MIHVLVADDEVKHRKCLAAMIRELRPGYMVSEAKNGNDALEIIHNEKTDIIFTDIRMPIMDGLSLLENLRDRMQYTKVVILSGFSSFEYAQKALKLGVFEYMLKPVDDMKMIEILEKIERVMEKENNEKQEKQNLQKQLNSTLPAYIDHLLNKWISGHANENVIHKIKSIIANESKGFVVVTEVQDLTKMMEGYSIDEELDICLNIKQWMKEALNPVGHSISFYLEDDRNSMTTVVSTDKTDGIGPDDIKKCLSEFQKNIKSLQDCELDVLFGVGRTYDHAFENARISFSEAYQAIKFHFYNDSKTIIQFSDKNNFAPDKAIDKLILSKELRERINNGNLNMLKDLVLKYINLQATSRIIPPDVLKAQIYELMLDYTKRFVGHFSEDAIRKLTASTHDLLNAKRCEELHTQINSLFSIMSGNIDGTIENKNDQIIKITEKYIQEHFREDIQLETVAALFHYNASYFSSFFKGNTGVNFSDYLQKIRLEKAVEILQKNVCRIYKVAELVGYHDVKYFDKVFKKEYGVSPNEYRRLNCHL